MNLRVLIPKPIKRIKTIPISADLVLVPALA
jgi:hypothetical protein